MNDCVITEEVSELKSLSEDSEYAVCKIHLTSEVHEQVKVTKNESAACMMRIHDHFKI